VLRQIKKGGGRRVSGAASVVVVVVVVIEMVVETAYLTIIDCVRIEGVVGICAGTWVGREGQFDGA
jgi:hypothetical protein